MDFAEAVRLQNQEDNDILMRKLGVDPTTMQRRAQGAMMAERLRRMGRVEEADQVMQLMGVRPEDMPIADPQSVMGEMMPQFQNLQSAVDAFVSKDVGWGSDPGATEATMIQQQFEQLATALQRRGMDPDTARAMVINALYPVMQRATEGGLFTRGDSTERLAQALGISGLQDKTGNFIGPGEALTLLALAAAIPLGKGGLAASAAGRGIGALRSLFGGAGRVAATAAPAAAPAATGTSMAANLGANAAGGAAMSGGMSAMGYAMGLGDDVARAGAGAADDLGMAFARGVDDVGGAMPLDDYSLGVMQRLGRGRSALSGPDDLAMDIPDSSGFAQFADDLPQTGMFSRAFGGADDAMEMGDDAAGAFVRRNKLTRDRQSTLGLQSKTPSPSQQAEARRLADGDDELYELLIATLGGV